MVLFKLWFRVTVRTDIEAIQIIKNIIDVGFCHIKVRHIAPHVYVIQYK